MRKLKRETASDEINEFLQTVMTEQDPQVRESAWLAIEIRAAYLNHLENKDEIPSSNEI